MHYLCSCLVVVFVLAVYLITDEIRYRRDVKRLRMTAVGHYCGQHRARHYNEHAKSNPPQRHRTRRPAAHEEGLLRSLFVLPVAVPPAALLSIEVPVL